MDRDVLRTGARELGLDLNEAQLEQFADFEGSLYQANTVMNLTRVPQELCVERHFLDSLLIHDLVGKSVCDLGCGPGFPAWPLACAKPNLKVTAVDSSSKMIGFLMRNPLPNLRPVQTRAEDWNEWGRFDTVTGRAVAPLSIQLELSARLAKVGGTIVAMRTPIDKPEIERLKDILWLELERVVERAIPGTDVVRVFPIWRKKRLTPKGYPRTWAEIKRNPL